MKKFTAAAVRIILLFYGYFLEYLVRFNIEIDIWPPEILVLVKPMIMNEFSLFEK
jgi:hypothetical protein